MVLDGVVQVSGAAYLRQGWYSVDQDDSSLVGAVLSRLTNDVNCHSSFPTDTSAGSTAIGNATLKPTCTLKPRCALPFDALKNHSSPPCFTRCYMLPTYVQCTYTCPAHSLLTQHGMPV
jgi:hypothetical protein